LKEVRDPIYQEVSDLKVFVGEDGSRKIVNAIVKKLKDEALLKE